VVGLNVFELKLLQNRFRPELRPGLRWGSYDAPPDQKR